MAEADETAPLIVVADDDRDQCMAMQRILERDDFRVAVAHDGRSAMELVREKRPSLVILDSMLPTQPGLACLKAIRSDPELHRTQVVMCSSKGDLDYVVSCTEAGAEGFFHKPVLVDSFADRIRRVMRGR